MKKLISLTLSILLVLTLFAGCKKTQDQSKENTKEKQVTIRIAGLKGPTTMGMVKLLSDNDNGKTENKYDFTLAASADELTPKLLRGELDIAALPINLASVLYNKSNGKVKMLAVNMLGAVYITEKNGNTVTDLKSLKGKTIYATGKGTTPEYVLSYLLKCNGLDINTDVNMVWKSEPTETVATLMSEETAVAMLPQPYLTVATTKIPTLRTALDLYEEWNKLDIDGDFLTAGIVVNSEFAENNETATKTFLNEYNNSTSYAKSNVEETATLIDNYGIVDKAIAQKALPNCHIVCITGKDMKKSVNGYLNVLFEQNPDSIGGNLPKDDFYLNYEK